MDRKYLFTALVYAIVGLGLGIHMAASQDHGQLVTHAHIMLLGFVVSFFYALCHKLWLHEANCRLATLQFYAHQAGTLVLLICLFLLYARWVPEPVLGPILGIASVTVLLGMLAMAVMVVMRRAPGD
ncbi:TonB-dependent receptor [Acidihalobacter yilgarnensis]|uniref:TonB-dependent receptor n=1 Tax=Acidihalobacter yilgarnensis TaxID=2819280 RepID=A0A1D8ILF1_9GAMM|nr:TonB-dependent receptor [Acidihalobacter yilgarnensis]AOU97287.1 TonB-dependent receptor [Acidihalobacter yilgarnensis]